MGDGLRQIKIDNLLQTAADIIPVGVIITSVAPDEVLFANPASERIFGAPVSSWHNNPNGWFSFIHEDDIGVAAEAFMSPDPDKNRSAELRIKRADGSQIWVSCAMYSIGTTDSGGNITALVFEDINELKRARTEVDGNRSHLIQAEKLASIGILVNGLAHEINNPNHTIMATSAILAEAWNDLAGLIEENVEDTTGITIAGTSIEDFADTMPLYLNGLMKASEKIRDIVFHLRDFAKQDVYEESGVDINRITQDAISLTRSFIQRRTAHFVVKYGKITGTVRGNPSRIQQVVINLIRNACQFLQSPEEAIRVSTRTTEDGTYAEIIVEDEGCGISREELGRILDPFYTTRRTSGGLGLGLSVSRSIVEDHGGMLEIESEPGEGTKAIIHLPISVPSKPG